MKNIRKHIINSRRNCEWYQIKDRKFKEEEVVSFWDRGMISDVTASLKDIPKELDKNKNTK